MKTKFTLTTLIFLFIFSLFSKSQIGVTYYQSDDSTSVPANKPIVIIYPAEITDTSGATLDVLKFKKYILFESNGISIAHSAFQTAPNEITIIPHNDMLPWNNYTLEIHPLKYKESGELTESFQCEFTVDEHTDSETVETAYLNTYNSMVTGLMMGFSIDTLETLASHYLPENLAYLKKGANQVERMRAVAPIFDAMAHNPGLQEELLLQSISSLGTIDEIDPLSAEGETERMLSLAHLFTATARQPEIADTLELLADTLLGVPQDFSLLSDKAKTARMHSLSYIFDATARQPEVFHTFLDQALKYHGAIQLTGNSTQETEAMRMQTLGNLFMAIARQPEALDKFTTAADTLLGVPDDFTGFDDQVIASRMQALSRIFESAARQPEAAGSMFQLAIRYMGRINDLNPLDSISEGMRMYALSKLWESIARQPEATEIMCRMADTLMGIPEDFTALSNFGKQGRIMGLASIFEAMTRQPEVSDTLLSKAIRYCGTSDQVGILPESAQSYAMITYGMALNAITRQPEMWRKIDLSMETLIGINRNYESFSDRTHNARASAIELLFESIVRQPLYCDIFTMLAEKYLGTAGQFTTIPDISRFHAVGSLIQSILFQFDYADTLDLAAERLIGVPDDFSNLSDEGIYMRYRAFNNLLQMYPSDPEVLDYAINILYKYLGKWEQINKESEFAQMARINAFSSLIHSVFIEPANTSEYLDLFEDILGTNDFSNLPESVKLSRYQALDRFYAMYNVMIDSTASDSLHKVAKSILGTNVDCPVETWSEAEIRMKSLADLFKEFNYGGGFIKAGSSTSEQSLYNDPIPSLFSQNVFEPNIFGDAKNNKDQSKAVGFSIDQETFEKFISVIEEFSGNGDFSLGSNNKIDYFRQIADGNMTMWLKSNAIHDTLIADARQRILGMYKAEKPKLYGDPSDGTIDVPIDYKMSLLFTDIMYTSDYTLLSQSSIQDSVKLLTIENEHVPFSIDINSNNRTITVVPSEELTYGMQYKLILPEYFINFDDSTANGISHQFKVEKALLKITAEDKEMDKGELVPELTMIFEGFVDGDSDEVITKPEIATEATSASSAGTYTITLTGGTSEKYTFELKNGTLTILSTTNVDDIDASGFKVYPNPVSNILYFDQHINELTIKRIEIINQIGQIVYSEQFNETKSSISISDFESGLYFVRFRMNDHSIVTKKIVKE